MNSLVSKVAARIAFYRALLLLLAILCASGPIGSYIQSQNISHHHGFYTIVKGRTTTEIFSVGTTYRLHIPYAVAPNCHQCKPVEPQLSVGMQSDGSSVNHLVRIVPGNQIQIELPTPSSRSLISLNLALSGEDVTPDTPPPELPR